MDKLERAYDRLRLGEKMSKEMYGKPLLLCYSGGKDSQVLLRLAIESGIDFEVQHSHTTVDAPETVKTVRETFKALEEHGITATINYPEHTMWQLIPQKLMPPTRLVRYCCDYLKEQHGKGRFIATGVRKGESRSRGKRGTVEDVLHDFWEEWESHPTDAEWGMRLERLRESEAKYAAEIRELMGVSE